MIKGQTSVAFCFRQFSERGDLWTAGMSRARLDVYKLYLLNLVYRDDYESEERRNALLARLGIHKTLASKAENGKVALIESGMDCDGVQYTGHVTLIDANFAAYEKHHDHVAEHADGRFWFAIMKPSDAKNVHYRSRDRALEAYEDGHPHSITYGSI